MGLKSIGRRVKRRAGKVALGVKKAGKVGVAAAKLGARLSNPVNQAKFVAQGVQGKGWVLPGSKYIGPGNAMDLGKPKSSADAAAYQHDLDYDASLKDGVKPFQLYAGFSDADQRLMKRSDVTTPDGLATYGGMMAKKIGHKLNPWSGKRLRN